VDAEYPIGLNKPSSSRWVPRTLTAEAHTVPDKDPLQSFREVGAPCPLCGEVAVQWYAAPGAPEGFQLPFGLKMHLEGQGRVQQCRVFRQLFAARLAAEREAEERPLSVWELGLLPAAAEVPAELAAPGEALKERLLEVWPSKDQPFARKPFHEVIRSAESVISGDRAPCPLCDARPENDAAGFKVPVGLKAHLSAHCREFAKIEAEVMKRGRSRSSGRLR
jgi:hypothetical protein